MASRCGATLAIVVFLMVAWVGNTFAIEGRSPAPENRQRPYAVVKAEMIKLGWVPFKATHFDSDSYCADDVCKRYPELFHCSCCGRPHCEFGFYKPGQHRYRIVQADGDEPDQWKVIRIFSPDISDMEYFRGRPKEPYDKEAKKLKF